MRKLLLFFAMLCVSIGAWAQRDGSNEDGYWLSFDSWSGKEVVTKINVSKPGGLAKAIAAINNGTYTSTHTVGSVTATYKTAKVVYIDTPAAYLNGDDLDALSSLDYETIDLQDAFHKESAEGEKKAFTFTNSTVKYVVLPDGWTKAEVNACGQAIAESNSSFGSTYSQNVNGLTETGDVTRYYYDNDGVKGEEYTGGQQYQENGSWYFKSYTDVDRVLTPVDGNPVCTYTNNFNGNKTYTVDESSVETKTYSWGGTYLAVTLSTFDVALNGPITKYYKTAEDGGAEMNTWDMQLIDGVYYYGGSWNYNVQPNVYENGKEAVVKTIFTYQDPFTNQQVTLEADDSRISTDKTYATIDFGSNSKEFEVKKKYFYTYENLKNEVVTESFDEERSTITLKQETVNALIAETNVETVTLGASVIAYVHTPNTLYDAMRHCFIDGKGNQKLGNISQSYFSCNKVKALTVSGNAVARDWSGAYSLAFTDGHMIFDRAADELGGAQDAGVGGVTRKLTGTTTSQGAIYGAGVYYLDLSSVKIDDRYCDDLNLTKATILVSQGHNAEVWIPAEDSGLKTIPADFGTNAIKEMCIPSNIEIIRTRAFPSCDHIWTTKGDESWENENTKYDNGAYSEYKADGSLNVEGNSSVVVSSEEHFGFNKNLDKFTYGTYTFGSNLKLIESNAFTNTEPNVKDVYVLNTTAPECHVDAFNTAMYFGHNGFDASLISSEGIVTRDAYRNNGRWITMLHYPTQTKAPNLQRYTDPTRDYSIATGEKDGNGSTIYFPNHSEFGYAYSQGTTGYVWNGWSTERNNINGMTATPIGDTGWSSSAQTTGNTNYANAESRNQENWSLSSFYDVTADGTLTPSPAPTNWNSVYWSQQDYKLADSKVSDNYVQLYDKDYRGWHQFVINGYSSNSKLNEEPYRSYISDNEWWTICPTFDITREESAILFGYATGIHGSSPTQYPFVSKLRYVIRDYGRKKISLNFSVDLTKEKENRIGNNNHAEVDDKGVMTTNGHEFNADDVVMKAGVPYLIKPSFPAGAPRQFRIFQSQAELQKFIEQFTAEEWAANQRKTFVAIANEGLYNKMKAAQSLSGQEQLDLIHNGIYTVPVFVSESTGSGIQREEVETDDSGKPKEFKINDVTYNKSATWSYSFVGTFYKSFLPQYCYFLGWDKTLNGGKGGARFYYNNKLSDYTRDNMTWANETGIITPVEISKLVDGKFPYTVSEAEDLKTPAQWKLRDPSKNTNVLIDDSYVAIETGAKLSATFTTEFNAPDVIGQEATGINQVDTDNQQQNAAVKVYTVDGQMMGNSLDGLPKGLYIVNGKKYVVK